MEYKGTLNLQNDIIVSAQESEIIKHGMHHDTSRCMSMSSPDNDTACINVNLNITLWAHKPKVINQVLTTKPIQISEIKNAEAVVTEG